MNAFFCASRLIRRLLSITFNLVQKPFYEELDMRARLHPFASIGGKRRVKLKGGVVLCAGARIQAGSAGFVEIGPQTIIHRQALLDAAGGSIKLGRLCSVNPFCVLYGHGGLTIGDGVRIAAGTVMIPANHIIPPRGEVMHEKDVESRGIHIGDDVWIGANVTVLDGVKIGTGAVVGAGAVVTKDVEPFHIAAGVPARTIRVRTPVSS